MRWQLGALVSDDTGIAADRIAVDRVVDRTVADAGFLHRPNDSLKRFEVLRRVAVQLNVADMTAVGQLVIRRLAGDLLNAEIG